MIVMIANDAVSFLCTKDCILELTLPSEQAVRRAIMPILQMRRQWEPVPTWECCFRDEAR